MIGRVTMSLDFSVIAAADRQAQIARVCDALEEADKAGRYPQLTVERPWSVHNPILEGEFSSPGAIRWYLERELGRLASAGARLSVSPGRPAIDLHDPALGPAVDETSSDLRRKKLLLFLARGGVPGRAAGLHRSRLRRPADAGLAS
jgi:AMP nucleosidase